MLIQHLLDIQAMFPNIEVGTIADPDVYCDSPEQRFNCSKRIFYVMQTMYIQKNKSRNLEYVVIITMQTAGNVTVKPDYKQFPCKYLINIL